MPWKTNARQRAFFILRQFLVRIVSLYQVCLTPWYTTMFKKSIVAGCLALLSFSAFAGSYYVVVPFTRKPVTTPDAGVKPPPPAPVEIFVTLNPSALPQVLLGQPYSYSLLSALQVSGDPNFDPAQASFSLDSGTLPDGLSLSSAGLLSGTPTGMSNDGQSVTLSATYKDKTGTQSYTLLPADPFFNQVTYLLHFDGTHGSSVFTNVKTANKRFGTASLWTGSIKGASLGSPDFTGAFTVEFWLYPGAAGGYHGVFGGATGQLLTGYKDANTFGVGTAGVGWHVFAAGSKPIALQWNHVAVQRDSNNLVSLYLNGTKVASGTVTQAWPAGSYMLQASGNGSYMDEVRITKGVARYSANFTPPSSPFPER